MSEPETKSVDLYGVLGVARDADTRTIRTAFRDQAKILHPDVPGGDKLKFGQLRLARDVLVNPQSRANYDAVGAIDDSVDNEQAALITVLTGQFGTVMHSVLSNGGIPSSGDFVFALQTSIKAGFENANKTIAALTVSLEQLRPLQGRFKVLDLEQPNHMETIVLDQIRGLERQIDAQRATLRNLEGARLYLNHVTFDRNRNP